MLWRFLGRHRELRDNLGRADTVLVTSDELIVQLWSGEGGPPP